MARRNADAAPEGVPLPEWPRAAPNKMAALLLSLPSMPPLVHAPMFGRCLTVAAGPDLVLSSSAVSPVPVR